MKVLAISSFQENIGNLYLNEALQVWGLLPLHFLTVTDLRKSFKKNVSSAKKRKSALPSSLQLAHVSEAL